MSFGKLWECMFQGSMVGMGPTYFAVWAYIIAHAKPPGEVEVNPRVVAALIGCSPEQVEEAMAVFLQPDPLSRNTAHDGRRLLPLGPFTYEVTGWDKYQQMRNEEARREQNRLAQQRFRERKQASAKGKQEAAQSAHVDVDVDSKKRGKSARRPESVSEEVWRDWLAHRRRKRATVTATVLRTFEREAEKAGMKLEDAIATSIAQGWAGFRAEWVESEQRQRQQRQQRHIPNLPLGAASCSCQNCVDFRLKQANLDKR